MKKRQENIELWRCLCMLAVVMGHVFSNNRIASMNGFVWHIPGFLLITGYFGAKLSAKKIVKLLGVVYSCYWLTIPFRSGEDTLLSLLLPHGGWFVPFYIVLLVMSPILNSAICGINRRLLLYIVVALLLIGWLPTLSSNAHLGMVKIPGFQGSGILLMMATYFIGYFIRYGSLDKRGKCWMWFMAYAVSVAALSYDKFAFILSNGYASPFVILTAVLGFVAFLHLPSSMGGFGKVINFLSPSMFGVYVLHECCLKKYQYFDSGGYIIIYAILMFLACLAIDMLRRLIVCSCAFIFRKYRICTMD